MESFPELLGEPCRDLSAVLLQCNFLLNIGQAVLTYCFVIKVLKDHHSASFAHIHPGVRASSVPTCEEDRLQNIYGSVPACCHPAAAIPELEWGWTDWEPPQSCIPCAAIHGGLKLRFGGTNWRFCSSLKQLIHRVQRWECGTVFHRETSRVSLVIARGIRTPQDPFPEECG